MLEASGTYSESDETVSKWETRRADEMAAQNAAMAIGEWGLSQGTTDADRFMRDVVEMGNRAGGFMQYQDRLGFYKDQVIRAQMAAVSRLGLGVVSGITENS